MKKTLLLLLSLSIIFLGGCIKTYKTKSTTTNLKIHVDDIAFFEEGVRVTLKPIKDSLSTYEVIRIGIIYGEKKEDSDLTLENAIGEVEKTYNDDDFVFNIKSIKENHYNINLQIRPFIEDNKGKIYIADNYKEFNLYEMAKKSSLNYAKRVMAFVDGRLINEIRLEVNYKSYSATSIDNRYKITLKSDYLYITIKLAVSDKNIFDSHLSVFINDEKIDSYTYNENEITIALLDPNWTMPY